MNKYDISKVEANYLGIITWQSIGKPLYTFLNIAFVLSTTLTLPIMFFGARNNLMMLVKSLSFFNSTRVQVIETEEESNSEKKTLIYQE